jgi:hypothetical protein
MKDVAAAHLSEAGKRIVAHCILLVAVACVSPADNPDSTEDCNAAGTVCCIEAEVTCSNDGSAIRTCAGGAWVDAPCEGGHRCVARAAATRCEPQEVPGLSVLCEPEITELAPGTTVTVGCTITSLNGWSGPVDIDLRPEADGLEPALLVPTVDLLAGAAVDIPLGIGATDAAPTAGESTVEVRASAAGLSATTNLRVVHRGNVDRVHGIYLLPAGREPEPEVLRGIDWGLRHLQLWLADQLGDGHTIDLAFPTVEVLRSNREEDWFADHLVDPGAPHLNFWFNVAEEVGVDWFDRTQIRIVYIDAQNPPDQPTGGAPGFALLPRPDVLGISGRNGPVCRWVGGLGHEALHAMGIPHPEGCDEWAPECDEESLMWLGYITYPNTYLTTRDVGMLMASNFIRAQPVAAPGFGCAGPP